MIDKISGLKEGEGYKDLKKDKEHLDRIAPLTTGPYIATDVMREQLKLDESVVKKVPQAVKYMNPQLKDHLINNVDLVTGASDRDDLI
jgi:hypothetical protein